MRIAVSNIAWDTVEDPAVAQLLSRHSVDAIDIAPGKYFPEPKLASGADIARVKAWWNGEGIEITGMQALLFGTTGLNVFGDSGSQGRLLSHLASVCRIAEGLGSTRLVFGSPKNRDRSNLTDAETVAISVDFFRRLGDIANDHGVIICLEPTPTFYGANFMTNSVETADIVARVAHSAIGMQFDTGAVTTNGEDPHLLLERYGNLIGHVHVSEPGLVPIGDGGADHESLSSAVNTYLSGHLVSLEMVATQTEPHLVSIDRALSVVRDFYSGSKS